MILKKIPPCVEKFCLSQKVLKFQLFLENNRIHIENPFRT